jgi:hypothetical protein
MVDRLLMAERDSHPSGQRAVGRQSRWCGKLAGSLKEFSILVPRSCHIGTRSRVETACPGHQLAGHEAIVHIEDVLCRRSWLLLVDQSRRLGRASPWQAVSFTPAQAAAHCITLLPAGLRSSCRLKRSPPKDHFVHHRRIAFGLETFAQLPVAQHFRNFGQDSQVPLGRPGTPAAA